MKPALLENTWSLCLYGWEQVRSFGKNGTISLADQLVASITNFFTGVIIGRACSKEDFGLYLLCFNIVLLVVDLQTSFLSSPYTVLSQKFRAEELSEYTGSTLVQQLSFCLLVVLILILGSHVLPEGFLSNVSIRPVLEALILAISFIMLKEFIRRLCFANLFIKSAFILDSVVSVIQLSGLSWLAFSGLMSAAIAFYVLGLACCLASLGWLFIYRGLYKISLNRIFEDWRRNWSFGSWTLGSSILWALSMTAYPWILAYFHGAGATGIWAACWGVASLANPLMLGVQNYMGPKIVRSYVDHGLVTLRLRVLKYSLIYVLLVLPLVLILMLGGGELIRLFYGEKYGGYGAIVRILGINILVMAAIFPLSFAILTLEKVRLYFMANVVPLIITLSCGILLVKKFGPFGVAIGLLLGISITATVINFCFFRSMGKARADG